MCPEGVRGKKPAPAKAWVGRAGAPGDPQVTVRHGERVCVHVCLCVCVRIDVDMPGKV